jgi:hypothetical protein
MIRRGWVRGGLIGLTLTIAAVIAAIILTGDSAAGVWM